MSAQVVQDDIRRDTEDGLLPPLFRGQQQPDFTRGTWAAAPLSASSAESPSVFIGGLHSSVTQALLAELCAQMGPLDMSVGNPVRLLKDQRTGLPKGVAFCDFARAESAQYAIAVLHDLCLAGQRRRRRAGRRRKGGSPGSPAQRLSRRRKVGASMARNLPTMRSGASHAGARTSGTNSPRAARIALKRKLSFRISAPRRRPNAS